MISMKKWIPTLSLGISALAAHVALAQSYPVVPDADADSARPYIWMNAASSNAALHGPGQPPGACTGSNPCYYFPSDVQTAYGITALHNGNGGAGRTIAIVDAFNDPQVANNLAIFSTQFGLPQCTVASGCLTIVNQTGGGTLPPFNANWAVEINLDVQWAHVMAPNAHILLVEATNNSLANLFAAVLYAQQHADVVSDSWGSNEFPGEATDDSTFSSSTVPILFSSGDSAAAGRQYPCASTYILCVGGTSLYETATSFRASEVGWSGSGGGCSTQIGMPPWQAGYTPCGTQRGMPDVAAAADPNTAALVYLAANIVGSGRDGFYLIGGTSWACPMTAGIVAQIQNARIAAGKSTFGLNLVQALYTVAAGGLYHYRYYDVTAGNNGNPAGSGWDLVTGFGVPLSPALTAALLALP
jgi:subtilase family serine protease